MTGSSVLRLPYATAIICTALLAAMFSPEITAAFRVWSSSTAYGHCFLIAPIAAWLAWERRSRLAVVAPEPNPIVAILIVPCLLAWCAADRLGVMEGRQFAALGTVWVAALACLGPSLVRAMAVPLAYLIFLVPFGAFIVPTLQHVTAVSVDCGLAALDIPHVVDKTTIEIPEGTFRVAEACAGLRFLIASIAFGALYAATMYRSKGRRLLFLAASIIVPIIANGLRALGIVLLGHFRGSAEAGAVDHVVYGWLFFSVVILALVALGLPFREDGADRRPFALAASPGKGNSLLAGAACLVLAGLGPACAALLDDRARDEIIPSSSAALLARLALPTDCTSAAPANGIRRLTCRGTTVVMRAVILGPHAGLALVLPALRDADPTPLPNEQNETEDVGRTPLVIDGGAWTIAFIQHPPAATASAVWIDGRPSFAGLGTRVALARANLTGSAFRPIVVTLAGSGPDALHVVGDVARAASRTVASVSSAQDQP